MSTSLMKLLTMPLLTGEYFLDQSRIPEVVKISKVSRAERAAMLEAVCRGIGGEGGLEETAKGGGSGRVGVVSFVAIQDERARGREMLQARV